MNTERFRFYYVAKLSKWSFIFGFTLYFALLSLTAIVHKITGYTQVGCYGDESVSALSFNTVFYGVVVSLNNTFPFLGDLLWVTVLSLWLAIIYVFVLGLLGLIVDIRRGHLREIDDTLAALNLQKLDKIDTGQLFQSSEVMFLSTFLFVSVLLNLVLCIWPESIVMLIYSLKLLRSAGLFKLIKRFDDVVPSTGWFFGAMLLSFCIAVGTVFATNLITAFKFCLKILRIQLRS